MVDVNCVKHNNNNNKMVIIIIIITIILIIIVSLVREESGLAKRMRSLWSAIYWVNPRLEGIESVCWVYGCKRVYFGYQNKD